MLVFWGFHFFFVEAQGDVGDQHRRWSHHEGFSGHDERRLTVTLEVKDGDWIFVGRWLWILLFGKQFLLDKFGKKLKKYDKLISLRLQVDIRFPHFPLSLWGILENLVFLRGILWIYISGGWGFTMVSVKLQVSVHQIFHTSRTKDWICLPLADGYCSQLSLQKKSSWPGLLLSFFARKNGCHLNMSKLNSDVGTICFHTFWVQFDRKHHQSCG